MFPDGIKACIQHAKQAQDIIRTINRLYQIEHEIDSKWSPGKKLEYRNRKAPPVLKKKLLHIKDDPDLLLSIPLAKAANYLPDEWS